MSERLVNADLGVWSVAATIWQVHLQVGLEQYTKGGRFGFPGLSLRGCDGAVYVENFHKQDTNSSKWPSNRINDLRSSSGQKKRSLRWI